MITRDFVRRFVFALTYVTVAAACVYVLMWNPSKAGDLSVSSDGHFLSGTYYRTAWFWRNRIRLWEPDLSQSKLVPCETGINVGGHFALSSDGEVITLNTRVLDSSVVLGLDTDGRLRFTRSIDTQGIMIDEMTYSADGSWLVFFGGHVEARSVPGAWAFNPKTRQVVLPNARRTPVSIHNGRLAGIDDTQPRLFVESWEGDDRSREFFFDTPDARDSLAHSLTRIAFQSKHAVHIRQAGAPDEGSDLVVAADSVHDREASALAVNYCKLRFDTEGENLVYLAGRMIRVIDAVQGQVLAERVLPVGEHAVFALFQDPEHILVVTSRAADENDTIVRWNFRTDRISSQSAGTFERSSIHTAQWGIAIAFGIWFLAFVIDGVRSPGPLRPAIDILSLLAALLIVVVVVLNIAGLNFELNVAFIGLLMSWVALATQWIGFSQPLLRFQAFGFLAVLIPCVILSLVADFELAESLVFCIAIGLVQLGIIVGFRRFGWTITSPGGSGPNAAVPTMRFSLRGLLIGVTISAVVMAYIAIEGVDPVFSWLWFIGLSIGPAIMATLAMWSVLSPGWRTVKIAVFLGLLFSTTVVLGCFLGEVLEQDGVYYSKRIADGVYVSVTHRMYPVSQMTVATIAFIAAWLLKSHGYQLKREVL